MWPVINGSVLLGIVLLFPIGVEETQPDASYKGPPMTLHAHATPLRTVLEAFVETSGITFAVDADVLRRRVTVDVDDVPWEKVLEDLLKRESLASDLVGPVLHLQPEARMPRTHAVRCFSEYTWDPDAPDRARVGVALALVEPSEETDLAPGPSCEDVATLGQAAWVARVVRDDASGKVFHRGGFTTVEVTDPQPSPTDMPQEAAWVDVFLRRGERRRVVLVTPHDGPLAGVSLVVSRPSPDDAFLVGLDVMRDGSRLVSATTRATKERTSLYCDRRAGPRLILSVSLEEIGPDHVPDSTHGETPWRKAPSSRR